MKFSKQKFGNKSIGTLTVGAGVGAVADDGDGMAAEGLARGVLVDAALAYTAQKQRKKTEGLECKRASTNLQVGKSE